MHINVAIAECLSTVTPTPFEFIRRDTGAIDAQIVEAVAWLGESGIGAYVEDNCVVVLRGDWGLLNLVCEENSGRGGSRKREYIEDDATRQKRSIAARKRWSERRLAASK